MSDSSAAPGDAMARRLARLGPMQTWIVNHDRSLLFAFLYIGLTIVLSIFISYFWLLVIVGIHIVFEWLKKGYLGYRAGRHRVAWTVWDVKYDLALVCLAFALASYTGATFGAAGAQSVGRAGVLGARMGAFARATGLSRLTALTRFSGVSRALQAISRSFVDIVFSARVALFRKADMVREASRGLIAAAAVASRSADRSMPLHAPPPAGLPWQESWTKGDWFALIVIGVNLTVVSVAPLITDHSYASLIQALALKLHPWPFE